MELKAKIFVAETPEERWPMKKQFMVSCLAVLLLAKKGPVCILMYCIIESGSKQSRIYDCTCPIFSFFLIVVAALTNLLALINGPLIM